VRRVRREVEVPEGDHVFGGAADETVRTLAGGREKLCLVAKAMNGREAVEGPGQPAGPGALARPALVRRLLDELAGLQIEEPLVGRPARSEEHTSELQSHLNL